LILRWHEREVLRRPSVHWTASRLRLVLRGLTWFLDRREADAGRGLVLASYQLRHQSVRDFLLSPDGPVPLQGLADVHEVIGRFYLDQGKKSWMHTSPYGRFLVVRHLLRANDHEMKPECVAEARRLLTDLRYLSATLGEYAPSGNGPAGRDRGKYD
jgi:hypothetical protein